MVENAKYIIFDRNIPVIFSPAIAHKTIAESVGLPAVRSAGYVMMVNGSPLCMGESTSLGISSRPEDTRWVRKLFGGGG